MSNSSSPYEGEENLICDEYEHSFREDFDLECLKHT